MLKLLGMALLFLGSAGTGALLARGLVKRTELILLIQRLLLALSNDLRYQKTPTIQLLKELSRDESYEKLSFLGEFRQITTQTAPFSQLWEEALQKQSGLQKDELELLRETGKILGSADSESQINALSLQQKKTGAHLGGITSKTADPGEAFPVDGGALRFFAYHPHLLKRGGYNPFP